MTPKGPACVGCPMYGDGRGFVGDEIVDGATTMIVAQNPGEIEEREGRPMVGPMGLEMDKTYFPIAGLHRGENVSIGNTLRCRLIVKGKRTNNLPTGKVLAEATKHCTEAYFRVPASTKLIVAQGAHAWELLGGPKPISSWRGYLAPQVVSIRDMEPDGHGIPVLGTLHLADLFRDPKMVLATMKDFEKVRQFHAGEWPLPFPTVSTNPVDVRWEDGTAFDTEYSYWEDDEGHHTKLQRFSVCKDGKPVVVEAGDRQAASMPAGGMGRVILQNAIGAADLKYLPRHTRYDDLLLAHAVLWSDFPHDLEYLSSIYSPYPKTKHLSKSDPVKYAAGDAVDTEADWLKVEKELDRDPRSRHIYETRMLPLVPILRRATRTGIRVGTDRAKDATERLVRICAEEALRAQTVCGYPINIGSPAQVVAELNRRGVKATSAEYHKVIEAIKRHPDEPLLQARLRWTQAEGFRRFVAPLVGRSRVYPSFLPTQATGRISVTNPPIVGFPDKGKAKQRGLPDLRSILIPDEGTWWLCFDWSAMHARFLAASAHDQDDLDAFEKGYDVHLMTACKVFSLPLSPDLTNVASTANQAWRSAVGWQDSDRRRHLVKTVRYSLLNGLSAKAVRESTEAIELGLNMNELESVAHRFLALKTSWTIWKRKYATDAINAREARSLYGRRRMLLGQTWDVRAKAALSGFYQMTEVDIMTETLIEVCRRYPEATLVYPSHDGIKLSFPERMDPAGVMADVKPWVERTHTFGDVTIPLPAEWEVVR